MKKEGFDVSGVRLYSSSGDNRLKEPSRLRGGIDAALNDTNYRTDPAGKLYKDLRAGDSLHLANTTAENTNQHVSSGETYELGPKRSLLRSIIGTMASVFSLRKQMSMQGHLAVFISLLSLALAFMFFSPTIVGHVVSDTSPSTLNQAGIISLSIAIISLFVYAFKQSGMKIIILSREKHKPQAMLR